MPSWSARRAISSPARAARCAISSRARWPRPPRRCEFERAARLRDRIAALSAIQGAQGVNPKSVEEADVFAIAEEAGQFCIEAFFFRTYQNWGNRAYFPRADKSLTPAEVLGAFLAQFYADRPAPRLVLLSHEIDDRALLADALSHEGRPPHRDRRRPSAAKSASLSSTRRRMRARRWAADWPRPPSQEKLLDGARRSLRPRTPAAPRRGL